MGTPKKCTVCELPRDVLDHVNSMLFLTKAFKKDVENYIEKIGLKSPSRLMLNRHIDFEHHKGDLIPSIIDSRESGAVQKKVQGELNLFERVALNVTATMMPQLAVIPESINVLQEVQELYVLTKVELAREIQAIRDLPIEYDHPDQENHPDETILRMPLTRNAKDLMKMMGSQLKDIHEHSRGIQSNDDKLLEVVKALMVVVDHKSGEIEQLEDLIFSTGELIDAEVVNEDD